MSENNQIKRCPFCSSTNVVIDSRISYWVRCNCCGASGPIRNTVQTAINEWNDINKIVHSHN
jgi:Lar family restriction alleviation protein